MLNSRQCAKEFARVTKQKMKRSIGIVKYFFGFPKFNGFEQADVYPGNVTLFKTVEEFIFWLDEKDLLMNLKVKDANLLLSYMSDHDFGVGIRKGNLVLVDFCDLEDPVKEISIDEIIDIVCDWNYDARISCYELKSLYYTDGKFFLYFQEVVCFCILNRECKSLDKLFQKTIYYKNVFYVL